MSEQNGLLVKIFGTVCYRFSDAKRFLEPVYICFQRFRTKYVDQISGTYVKLFLEDESLYG